MDRQARLTNENRGTSMNYGSRYLATGLSLFCLATGSAAAADLSRSDAIYNSLPAEVKSAGVINAATAADYPPFEFLDENGKLIGADIEISEALGTIMGVPVKNHATEFSNIMPGIQAKRFDIGMSSMGDYESREKTVDFVDYYRGGTSFLILADGKAPEKLEDICGTKVGALKGTSSETQAEDSSKKCVEMGKPAIDVSAFPTQNDAVLALTSRRIDSVSGDGASNGYSAQQFSGKLRNVGFTVYGDRPYYGIAVPKGSPLYQPLFDATKVLIESGKYKEILDKWGIADGALEAPLKNQASPG
jgi:polar amino acid transport system substrate-binding protein